jgi:hypothetical protein
MFPLILSHPFFWDEAKVIPSTLVLTLQATNFLISLGSIPFSTALTQGLLNPLKELLSGWENKIPDDLVPSLHAFLAKQTQNKTLFRFIRNCHVHPNGVPRLLEKQPIFVALFPGLIVEAWNSVVRHRHLNKDPMLQAFVFSPFYPDFWATGLDDTQHL